MNKEPEVCRACNGPQTVSPEEDIPLCNGHWGAWLDRYLYAGDDPCAAHLISKGAGDE